MKKITLFLFALFTCWQINAQVSLYGFSQSNGTYTAITGGTLHGTAADDVAYSFTLPFTFNFGGTDFTTVRPSSNGFLVFGGTAPSTTNYTPISTAAAASNNAVAAFSRDLNATVRSEVLGTAPNRVYVCQWSSAYRYAVGAGENINFQIKLYETTNIVEFVYGNFTTTNTTATTGPVQVGLRGTANTVFNNRTTTTDWSASLSGTVNTATMAGTSTVKPASGLTYIWTPPVPCSGAPVAGTVTPALQNICSGTTPANLIATGFSSGVTGLTFQWEESNDDGATDAWAPAVGGTGATTATYTPPAFSGTPIYYRLNVTCTNSSSSAQTASVLVSTPITPTNQITAVTIPAGTVNYAQAVINWTNGNGNRRVVYISNSATFTDPVNGNAPALTANTVYAGSGQQIIFDGTGATVTVTGLATGTQYYIKAYEYVRCGSGPYDYYYNVTTGTNIGTFTTCGVYAVPALEDFTTFVPSCWSNMTGGDLITGPTTSTGSGWVADGFANVGGTGAIKNEIWFTGANDWFISPLFNIPATGYELRFMAAAPQWNSTSVPTSAWEADDFIQVLVSTGMNNWTVLYTYDNTNQPSNTGDPNIIDLDAYSGQDVRFAFRAVEGATNGAADIDFSIDDFEIRETPPCVDPTALTATNLTSSSADLSWVDPSGTQYDYYYVVQPAGGGVPAVAGDYVDIGDLPLTVNTLSSNTNYEFWVRADCGGAGFSAWVGPFTFRTLCDAITTLPHAESFDAATNPSCWSTVLISGSTNWAPDDANDGVPAARTGARFAGKSWVGNDDALLISPVYNLAAYATDQARLNVWIYRSASGLATDRVTFYANTTNNLTGATMLVDVPLPITSAPTVSTAGWYNYIVNVPLSFNTGGDFYIIAQGRTSSSFSSYSIGFDDYVLELVPACPEPTGLSVSSLTSTSATVAWTATTGNYEYVLDNDAALPAGAGTVLSGETYNATPLTPSTTYYFHVRSDCGSTWSTVSFTTPAAPPANDECVNAVALTVNPDLACGTVTAGTTQAATDSGIEPTFTVSGTPDNDVWYSFVATGSAHRISLLNLVAVTGFSTDMGIAVFDGTGTCSALTLVGSSDPETYNLTGLTPGTTYYVAVYGWGAAPGAVANFNICVGTPPAPPANDECVNAIAISSMPYNNTQDASAATGPVVSTCSGMNDGVWYTVVGNGGDIIIDVTAVTGWDPELGVYTGSCGTFTCVDSIDDEGTSEGETYTIVASTLGTTYYINVGHYNGFGDSPEGPFTIDVTTTLSSDSFDNANFTAYPNPVKDVLNVSYTSEISSIRVINMIGQEVISKNINATSTQVDMSQLSAGTYIVNVTVGDNVKTLKVVKQ
ncbi:MAG: T9SS type A sorting domain-containing protein [Flavobacterium sp.]|nr:MAG: T9SS type A sorting domain-containing protein [Flavobacterium sp.]